MEDLTWTLDLLVDHPVTVVVVGDLPDVQPGAGRRRLLEPDGQPLYLSPRPAVTS